MSTDPENFIIVGGGLGGALLAALLGKQGRRVDVYEARPDLRLVDASPRSDGSTPNPSMPAAGLERSAKDVGQGRSINLALSYRGICALERAGLAEQVLSLCIPMRGRMIHAKSGATRMQPYGVGEHQVIRSISRAALNKALLDAAQGCSEVSLHFHHRCTQVDFSSGRVEFETVDSGERITASGGPIIGADGAFSVVRRHMQRIDRFNYEQSYLEHGYKELTIPAGPVGAWQLAKDCLHIWPRKSYMMIALPNTDGSFTCTLFLAHRGAVSFEALQCPQAVARFFEESFPDAAPLLADFPGEFLRNPTGSLATIRCSPWRVGSCAVLLGDACHAVVPFYGQGMNAAFEDALVLAELLHDRSRNTGESFAEYERLRKPHTDALADLAIENFVEMRDKTSRRSFRWKKKIDAIAHRIFPRAYLPLYAMVTFTRMPYGVAKRRAVLQDRVLMVIALLCAAVLLLIVFSLIF